MHRRLCTTTGLLAGLFAIAACGPDSTTVPPDRGPAASAPLGGVALELNEARMFAAIEHLAADALHGRYSLAVADLGAAADYIVAEYKKVGLQPVGESFRTPFTIESGWEPGPDVQVWVEVGEEVIEFPADKIGSLANGNGDVVFGDATFVGAKTPKSVKGAITIARLDTDTDAAGLRARANELQSAGARGIVLIAPSLPTTDDRIDATVPVVLMAESEAVHLMPKGRKAVGKKIPGLKISLAAKQLPLQHPSFNVLSWIPGTDRPDEIVILGAHFDHIGTNKFGHACSRVDDDTTCNGADDNASGSAMVLEIARTLAESGYQPRRTLVFAHFAGEELGLLGSKALADEPPDAVPFKTGKVVAMINLDMVGRYREEAGLQVGAVSSSDQWRELVEAAGPQGLRLVFERSVTARSDHANFYSKKIPVLFFFTGLHDDYHRVGDHAEKINREGMAAIARIVGHLTTAVGNGARLDWSEPRSAEEGAVSRLPASDAKTIEQP